MSFYWIIDAIFFKKIIVLFIMSHQILLNRLRDTSHFLRSILQTVILCFNDNLANKASIVKNRSFNLNQFLYVSMQFRSNLLNFQLG